MCTCWISSWSVSFWPADARRSCWELLEEEWKVVGYVWTKKTKTKVTKDSVWQALTNSHGFKMNPTVAAWSVDDPYQSRPSFHASTLKIQAAEYSAFLCWCSTPTTFHSQADGKKKRTEIINCAQQAKTLCRNHEWPSFLSARMWNAEQKTCHSVCLAMGQLRSAPTSFSHPTLQAISLPSLLFVLKIENTIEFDYIHTVHAKYCKHFLFVCFIFFEAVRLFFLLYSSCETLWKNNFTSSKEQNWSQEWSPEAVFRKQKRFGRGLFLSYSDTILQRCFSVTKTHPATLMQFHYSLYFNFEYILHVNL